MKILIGKDYPKEVIKLIRNAKTNIDILMYHWGFYSRQNNVEAQKFTLALKSAFHRGVSIRTLLHCGNPGDNLRHKNLETVNHLRSWGIKAKLYTKSGTLHSKLVLIDKKYAILGSHNISKKAFTTNVETSVVVEGSGDIRRLIEYYNILWSKI